MNSLLAELDDAITKLQREAQKFPPGSMARMDLTYALNLLRQARARIGLVLK